MIDKIINDFQNIGKTVITKSEIFEFKTSDLPDENIFNTDIRQVPVFRHIFQELNAKKDNCIYWFSLVSDKESEELVQLLDSQRKKLKIENRTVPPRNKNENSKTIYVGIRRGGFIKKSDLSYISGRIIQHLGYYKIGSTQGLQLVHWASKVNFKVFLNVVELKDLPNEYLNVVEQIVAYELKPLCGRH